MPGFQAALDGLCLAYVPDDLSRLHIERGELREVLAAWSLRCQGFHLYYPNRRQASPAFSVLVDALRYQAGSTQLT
jgi:DNA-binding transcriptional LysR family regulator